MALVTAVAGSLSVVHGRPQIQAHALGEGEPQGCKSGVMLLFQWGKALKLWVTVAWCCFLALRPSAPTLSFQPSELRMYQLVRCQEPVGTARL